MNEIIIIIRKILNTKIILLHATFSFKEVFSIKFNLL